MSRFSLVHEEVWYPFSESITEWDFDFHSLLLNDSPRMSAYKAAIFSAVQPGDIVVDLGTGTGILAVWALQAGASHVYAIDFNETVLLQAKKHVAEHGFSGRCTFYQDISYRVQLPEKCDLVISEIIGNIGDNEDFLAILKDARQRFLKPDGRLLPEKVVSYLTPIEALSAHDQIGLNICRVVNRSYDLTHLLARNNINSRFDIYYDAVIPDDALLGAPTRLREFRFGDEEQPEYEVEIEFSILRHGVLTGFKGHFVAQLTGGVVLDISSGDIAADQVSCSWKHAYFPLKSPFTVAEGDRIVMSFSRSYPAHNQFLRQVYRWSGTIFRNNLPVHSFKHGMDARTSPNTKEFNFS